MRRGCRTKSGERQSWCQVSEAMCWVLGTKGQVLGRFPLGAPRIFRCARTATSRRYILTNFHLRASPELRCTEFRGSVGANLSG